MPMLLAQDSEDAESPASTEEPFAEDEKAEPKVDATLPDDVMAAVVTIQGDKGSGTGFVAKFRGSLVIITNQHVLGNNARLTIKDNRGLQLKGTKFAAASDADIAMIQLDKPHPDQPFLKLAESTETASRKDTQIMIPGNSNGDGVVTVTPGKVIGIGAKKVEVDNPIYPGNSGSPIVVKETNEVIGVLTEAHILELDAVSKKSFENEDSQIKSEIRYFGHRIDNVSRWQGMNWNDFRNTSDQLATLKFELESLANYLFKDDKAYMEFEELAKSNERAMAILKKRASGKDKIAAIKDVTRYMRFLATRHLQKIEREPMYFIHKQNFASLKRLSDHVVSAVKVLEEDFDALEKVVY